MIWIYVGSNHRNSASQTFVHISNYMTMITLSPHHDWSSLDTIKRWILIKEFEIRSSTYTSTKDLHRVQHKNIQYLKRGDWMAVYRYLQCLASLKWNNIKHIFDCNIRKRCGNRYIAQSDLELVYHLCREYPVARIVTI